MPTIEKHPNGESWISRVVYNKDVDGKFDAIALVTSCFAQGRNVQTRPYNYLNGRSILDCVDDWTKRWNGLLIANSDLLESWQSNIFLNFTRNQVISYLSKVARNPVKAKIKAIHNKFGIRNKKIEQALEAMVRFSHDQEKGDSKFMSEALEVTIKGTAFVYETYGKFVQNYRDPVEFDPTTGEGEFVKTKEIVYDNCLQQLVPLEDMYFPNPFEPDIQMQPWVLWRQKKPYSVAQLEFGQYKDFKDVVPGSYILASEPTTFYREDLSMLIPMDHVEVLRYYNRQDDRHIIVCNGIVLYDGPNPFKSKKYPFARGIFEPFGTDFIWGAGFPQKIMGDQDLVNTVWNLMIDKTYASAYPPILSSDFDDLVDDDIMEPAKVRQVSDISKWKPLDIPGINGGDMNMLAQAVRFVNDNGGNPEGGSDLFSPKGGRVPVRQAIMAQEESMKKIGFNSTFLEDLERDRTELRLYNIIQFYSIPKIEEVTGEDGALIKNLAYRNDIVAENMELSNGKRGTKIIKLTDKATLENPEEAEKTRQSLDDIEFAGEEMGNETEASAIAVDIFNDYKYAVQVVRQSSFEMSRAVEQSFRQEYAQWRLAVAPELTNKQELVAWVDESFDVPADRFTNSAPMSGNMMGPGGMPGAQGAMPGQQPQAPQQLPEEAAA